MNKVRISTETENIGKYQIKIHSEYNNCTKKFKRRIQEQTK